ncbi:pantetheine-phosphate adenylyltransferase [Candidatus Woesearchaeota archaeon]|nr:pantetheine-phosphate adenylyltransferase [Candidatus Woesearchaeota archaeon]
MSKTAVYAGTFDPITNGHVDIIERGLKIFDKLIIAVASTPKKALFSAEERVDMIKQVTKGMNVEVESFDGLLVNFVKKKNCNVTIRGLRAISDFEYEFQMAHMNRKQNKDIDSVYVMTSQKYSFLSSSVVKEVAMLKGNIKDFVPEIVENKLKEKFE